MIQRLILVLILIAPLSGAAEGTDPATGLTIGCLEATHGTGTEYRFPLIGGESLAAARINAFLQTRELHRLPGRNDATAFENVWPEEGSPNGVTSLDYTLAFNQPGVLSVDISGLYYGAYESPIGGSYYFDTRTGEVITTRSLFTAKGLAKLDDEVTQARLRRVDDFLAGKKLSDGAQLGSDPKDAEDQRELYRECRSQIEKGHPVVDDQLALDRDQLSLQREPCAPRVLQAIDDLDFHDTRGVEQIGELLNDYGRCLLIARRTNCQRSYAGINAGVYRGKIGERYPITLVVENVDFEARVRATYFYDKQAKAIGLNGAVAKDGGVQLDERGPPPARFALRVQPDGRLLGEWIQEGKAPQEVELR